VHLHSLLPDSVFVAAICARVARRILRPITRLGHGTVTL
jgi:hypothetical protein